MLARLVVVFACGSVLTVPTSTATAAEARSFPYEAVVRTAEVEVRSGPGQRYYVTGRVRLNDRVTVHRHDPGGWYMIAPPPGSFSYVDAALVRRTGDASGTIDVPPADGGEPARAIVRIGSELSDEHAFYGRELASGDAVQILGEKLLNTDRGAVRMYRIVPPEFEYRWVKGDFIVPVGEAVTPVSDPGSRNSMVTSADTQKLPAASAGVDPFASPLRPVAQSTATSPSSPPTVSRRETDVAMDDLDLRYLELIQQSPEHWDLDGLVRDYESLRLRSDATVQEQIDRRLSALESRRKVWSEYQDFVRLTTETAQRDASLAAAQAGVLPINVIAAPPAAGPQLPPEADLGTPTSLIVTPNALPTANQPGAAATAPMTPKFDGAGIVQRLPTGRRGQSILALTDPHGRVLALLQAPPSLGLERYVGQSLGVIGQRFHDPRLRSDVINVRQVQPVQLAR